MVGYFGTDWTSPLMLLRRRISLFITDENNAISILPSSPLLKELSILWSPCVEWHHTKYSPTLRQLCWQKTPDFSVTEWQGPSKKIKQSHKKSIAKDLNSRHKLISHQWTRCHLKWYTDTIPHLAKNPKDTAKWLICSQKYINRCSWIQFTMN